MGAKETLTLLVHQAQMNGFNFQRWFERQVEREWAGETRALTYLALEKRYYALLFSHEFARYFWRPGAQIAFTVPSVTYERVNGKGEVIVVTRKPFTRRTMKPDAWKYHIRQMAAAEDPLAYQARFLLSPHAKKASMLSSVLLQAGKTHGKGMAQA